MRVGLVSTSSRLNLQKTQGLQAGRWIGVSMAEWGEARSGHFEPIQPAAAPGVYGFHRKCIG